MSALDIEDPHVPDQLVDQLARGYDALAHEVKQIHEQHRNLENKLAWAKQQYLDVLKRHSPSTSNKDFHDFLAELEEAGATQKEGETDWLDSLSKSLDDEDRTRAFSIQRARDAREKIRFRRSSDGGAGVRIWAGRSVDEAARLERDFTTRGTAGRLGCPFAAPAFGMNSRGNSNRGVSTPRSSVSKASVGRRSKRPSFHDPIRAEVCGFGQKPPDPSMQGSIPLCPIRFLDQHSPEEVAKYFENHKHELPRSHEFCVKRFQENEEALRNIDSKYANIVSMVKELGKVHQPIFPQTDEIAVEDAEIKPHNPDAKVETWAKDVQDSAENEDEAIDENADAREQRFDRPLTDIRVGESPSRPWGIPVPDTFPPSGDARSKKSDRTASPLEPEIEEPNGPGPAPLDCPYSGSQLKDADHRRGIDPNCEAPPKARKEAPDEARGSPKSSAQPPRIVFNGPVFFGYGPDKIMSFMSQLGQKN